MNNYGLYYPTIEFTDYEWLWRASLLWDRIYRIVPDGYEPDDPPNIRALAESREIAIPIYPGGYASEIKEEFCKNLAAGKWNAAALDDDMSDEYKLLHANKVDVVLREMIIQKGIGKPGGDWLRVPTSFATHYMTYLANRIAKRNSLHMLSDNTPSWTSATYFRYDGDLEEYPHEELPQQLATFVVRDFLPSNILAIPPNLILSFREKYRAERQRFMASIRLSATKLSNCENSAIAEDIIHDIQKDIEATLKEFRGSLRALKLESLTGLKSLTFPIATTVATAIFGKDLSPETLKILLVAGAAIGLVSGLCNYHQKEKKLQKECDYSYLMHLRREWQGIAMYNND
jgi:hypothetical protein